MVDKFMKELKEALVADIQDKIMKEGRCKVTLRNESMNSMNERPPEI
jgi:hypothetical protein